MKDPRIEKLAKLLINYSVSLKKGEKILIEAFDVDYMLVAELVKEVYRVGGYPFVEMVNNRVQREILMGAGEEECKLRAKYAAYRMNDMDAYIGLRGGENGDLYIFVTVNCPIFPPKRAGWTHSITPIPFTTRSA